MIGYIWANVYASFSGASPPFLCRKVLKTIILLSFIVVHGRVFYSFTVFCERLPYVLYQHMIILFNALYLIFMRNNELFCIYIIDSVHKCIYVCSIPGLEHVFSKMEKPPSDTMFPCIEALPSLWILLFFSDF